MRPEKKLGKSWPEAAAAPARSKGAAVAADAKRGKLTREPPGAPYFFLRLSSRRRLRARALAGAGKRLLRVRDRAIRTSNFLWNSLSVLEYLD